MSEAARLVGKAGFKPGALWPGERAHSQPQKGQPGLGEAPCPLRSGFSRPCPRRRRPGLTTPSRAAGLRDKSSRVLR